MKVPCCHFSSILPLSVWNGHDSLRKMLNKKAGCCKPNCCDWKGCLFAAICEKLASLCAKPVCSRTGHNVTWVLSPKCWSPETCVFVSDRHKRRNFLVVTKQFVSCLIDFWKHSANEYIVDSEFWMPFFWTMWTHKTSSTKPNLFHVHEWRN